LEQPFGPLGRRNASRWARRHGRTLAERTRGVCSLANRRSRGAPVAFAMASKTRLGRKAAEDPTPRPELFSAERMEQHGKDLAAAHRLAPRGAPNRLLARLGENERLLAEVR